MDWTPYLTANADVQTSWDGLTPEEQALFGNPQAYAEWHWNTAGQTEGRPGGPQQYAGPGVRDEINSGMLAGIADDQFTASDLNAGSQYDDAQAGIANQFNDGNVDAARTRYDLEQTGQTAYDDRMGFIGQDYAAAQGYTDNEIAAWEQVAAIERAKNENMVKADFGISGQYGKAVRNLGQIGEEYGANRALYEGQRRRTDYGQMATSRYGAYGDLAATRANAAEGYGNYTSQNLAQYYDGNQAASRAYWGQVNQNQGNYAGGLASNYQDWLNQRNRQSDMGFNYDQLATNAGQVATTAINSSNQAAADAYANSQYQRADANSNMWNNIGSSIGNAAGSFKWGGSNPYGNNTQKPPPPPPPPAGGGYGYTNNAYNSYNPPR